MATREDGLVAVAERRLAWMTGWSGLHDGPRFVGFTTVEARQLCLQRSAFDGAMLAKWWIGARNAVYGPSICTVTPAFCCSRSSSTSPIADAGVWIPPLDVSESRARHMADSASIFAVEP